MMERFGERRYAHAYNWVYEQAWKFGYEHQACIALAKIDFPKAAPYIRRKIVEARFGLNEHNSYPFDPSTLGVILENIYEANPLGFVNNYKRIKQAVKKKFYADTLQTIPEPHRTKIDKLIRSDNKNLGSRPKKGLR